MDLFEHAMQEDLNKEAPLAARLRPRTLDEFVGQEHIIGEGKLLRRAITADRLFSSIILTAPPGTGKTLCARAVATRTDATFIRVIGSELVQRYVGEGARMVRELFQMAKQKKACIIFFDEIDAVLVVLLAVGFHPKVDVSEQQGSIEWIAHPYIICSPSEEINHSSGPRPPPMPHSVCRV